MEKVKVVNPHNGKTLTADVLYRNDKTIKVVIFGMDSGVTFTRTDIRKPYESHIAGIELRIEK